MAGHLLNTGIFNGEPVFIIKPIDENHIHFYQRETFSGLLVPLFLTKLELATKCGFQEMNNTLKKRAEGG